MKKATGQHCPDPPLGKGGNKNAALIGPKTVFQRPVRKKDFELISGSIVPICAGNFFFYAVI
jgi:hypothetical protein